MPKKTRREKLRASRRPLNIPQAAPRSGPAPTTTADRPTIAPAPTRVAVPQLTFDYHYVYNDLRRIAILAVSFFALLIVLSFVLR